MSRACSPRARTRDATEFGAPVDAGAVKGAHIDLLASTRTRPAARSTCSRCSASATTSGGATYVTRVQPGLTLAARKRAAASTFTVTDAGDPVKGATVKVGGRVRPTDAKGRVTLALPRARRRATATGYEAAKLKVR